MDIDFVQHNLTFQLLLHLWRKRQMKRTSFLLLYVFVFGILFFTIAPAEATVFNAGDYQYVLLPDGTAEIQEYSGSEDILAIPYSLNGVKVSSIGNSAFYECLSFTSVIIPNSITSIGNSAFGWCRNLTDVIIPESVTSIEDNAFYSCNLLSAITIPDNVSYIGKNPFCNCESLSSITISPDHPVFAAIDHVLFKKTDKSLLCYPMGKDNLEYKIPQGIAVIKDSAFSNCSRLTAVTIPDSVTSIEVRAFSGCSNLKKIIIPDSVTSIEKYTFRLCTSLTDITIPNSIISIGDYAFDSCENLISITIPDSVTTIGDYAFSNCSNLTEVTIPDSVTSIGINTFNKCGSLTLIVSRDSYAAQYCKNNQLNFLYTDSLDWLNQ